MTANALRGEVSIELEGVEYVLRPTFEAVTAIEQQTGRSVMQLSVASQRGALSLEDSSIIVTECIKAWGRETNRSDTPHFTAQRVAELIYAEGMIKAQGRVDLVLTYALTGGYRPGEASAAGVTTAATPTKNGIPAAD